MWITSIWNPFHRLWTSWKGYPYNHRYLLIYDECLSYKNMVLHNNEYLNFKKFTLDYFLYINNVSKLLNIISSIGIILVTSSSLLKIYLAQYYLVSKSKMSIFIFLIKTSFLCYFLTDQKVTKKSSGEINSSGNSRTQTVFRRLKNWYIYLHS